MGVGIIDYRSLKSNWIKRKKEKKQESETLDLSNSPEKEPFPSNTDK